MIKGKNGKIAFFLKRAIKIFDFLAISVFKKIYCFIL